MFMVLGDFNFDLEEWKREADEKELHEILIGWELYPKDNRSQRGLRNRPIDYMLVYAPGNINVRDDGSGAFSPLPLEISCDGKSRIYCSLSATKGHKQAVFTTEDLKSKKIKSSAALHGNMSILKTSLTAEHFEAHEAILKDPILSKYVFDHDFLYLSICFISTVSSPRLKFTDDQANEDTTPEAENLKQKTWNLSPPQTMDKGKKRISKECRDLEMEATVALHSLRENEYWIKSTENHTPEEWLKETNELLCQMEIRSLQQLLLSLPLPNQ